MKPKHVIQLACILIGIALLAYNVNALPTQSNYPTVNNLELHETTRGSIALDWSAPNAVQIDTNHDVNPDTNQAYNTPIYTTPQNYLIYKSTGSIGESDEGSLLDITSATDYVDGDVSENATYFYRIRVRYTNGLYAVMGSEASLKTSRTIEAKLDENTIDLYAGGTQSVNLHLQAPNDNETHDVKIRFSSTEDELSANADVTEFTLNSEEETDIAINVEATNQIDDGTYRIDVKVTSDSITKTIPLTVHIGEDGKIDFTTASGITFCNNAYSRVMDVQVKNNTNKDLEELGIEVTDSALGATVDPTDLNLRHGQTKIVKLAINIDPASNQTGDYFVILAARPLDQTFVSYGRIPYTLRNCAITSDQSFNLSWKQPQATWEKGKQYDVNYSIIPAGAGSQEVDVNVWTSSPMLVQYAKNLYLQNNQTLKQTISFFPQDETIPGDLNIIIRASNGSVIKELKVNRGLKIAPKTGFSFSASRSTVSVIEGFQSEVEFVIQNSDVDQTFAFTVNADSDVKVMPLNNVSISKRETKTIRALVTITPNTGETKYVTINAISSGSGSQSARVKINVLRDNAPNYNALQVVAYNETIRMDPADEQEVTFSLRNDVTHPISDITIKVAGLPAGANFPPITLNNLNPAEVRNVASKITTGENTPNGTYELQWTINAGRFTKRVKSTLIVGPENKSDPIMTGIGTGFAFLGQNWLGGLIILLAMVGALFVLGIIGRNTTTKTEKKEVWLKK